MSLSVVQRNAIDRCLNGSEADLFNWDDPCCGVLRLRGVPEVWDKKWLVMLGVKINTANQEMWSEEGEAKGVAWAVVVNQTTAQRRIWHSCGWREISNFNNPNTDNMVSVWELELEDPRDDN